MKTESGFEFEFLPTANNDAELLDCFIEMSQDGISNNKFMLDHMIGKKGRDSLYEYCRKDGVVQADMLLSEITDLIHQLTGAEKNS